MRKVYKRRRTTNKSRRRTIKRRGGNKTARRRRTKTRQQSGRRKTFSYNLSEWDYMPNAPSNCGNICYAWHKNNNKYRYSNPQKIVDAFKAVERTPKYEACCAPDRPLNLMEDLSNLSQRYR
jgi:hypothetical protein